MPTGVYPRSKEAKEKMSIAAKKRGFPSEIRKLGSESNRGKSSWNKGKSSWSKGKHLSEDHKQKISQANWKGGNRLMGARRRAKRQTYGSDFINEPFEGCEGHHIDRKHVVFIPKMLHRSIWHSMDKKETMERINTKVICWLLGKNI
jgi:hypothetical protein